MVTLRSFNGFLAAVGVAGLLLIGSTAQAGDGTISMSVASQLLKDMDRAAAAMDIEQWAQYVAPDCEVVVHTRAGGQLQTLRMSRSEYMSMASEVQKGLKAQNVTYIHSSTPAKIRLEDGAHRAVATTTLTEQIKYPGGQEMKTVSTVTAHLEYRGDRLQVVRLNMLEAG